MASKNDDLQLKLDHEAWRKYVVYKRATSTVVTWLRSNSSYNEVPTSDKHGVAMSALGPLSEGVEASQISLWVLSRLRTAIRLRHEVTAFFVRQPPTQRDPAILVSNDQHEQFTRVLESVLAELYARKESWDSSHDHGPPASVVTLADNPDTDNANKTSNVSELAENFPPLNTDELSAIEDDINGENEHVHATSQANRPQEAPETTGDINVVDDLLQADLEILDASYVSFQLIMKILC